MSKNDNKNKTKSEERRIKFIQVALTVEEREIIREYAKENKETSSTFCRRIIFDFIRRKENPELFNQPNQINPTILEELFQRTQETFEIQKKIDKRLEIADNIEEVSELLQKEYERLKKKGIINDLPNETKTIANLLKAHKSLSPNQISEMTNIDFEKVLLIITNSKIFKLNITTGRYCLR